MKILFIDESGDHNLAVIDPQYPLQLADLVVTPIGRHVLGKPSKEDFDIVRSKLRRSRTGVVEGYGLVVLPK